MKQETTGKIVLCSVLGCFFLNIISVSVFAVDKLDPVMRPQKESFGVVKVMELFQNIGELREDRITIDDIETMVEEINSLHDELYASLFYPDEKSVIQSEEECSAIREIAALYLLRSATLVMSLLGDIIQAGNNPPQNALQLTNLGMRLVRKVIDLVTVSSNALLTTIQYISCRRSSEVN
jgi:hypothetical protein